MQGQVRSGLMRFFNPQRDEVESLKNILVEARQFILQRGVYYYSNDRRGPGAALVDKIDQALEDKEFFGDK